MKLRIVISMVIVAMAAAMVGGATLAWFTSEAVSEGNTFTAGTLRLDINDSLASDGSFAIDIETLENLAPGDVMDEWIILHIVNEGSLDLAWFGRFFVDGDLAGAIYIEDAQMEFLNADGEADKWEVTDHFIHQGRGHGPYPTFYESLAEQSEYGVVMLTDFLAANAMGSGGGVHMGALKPGFSYRLSVRLGIAELAGNEFQGKSATIHFEAVATQVNAAALEHLFAETDWLAGAGSTHLSWLNNQLAKQH